MGLATGRERAGRRLAGVVAAAWVVAGLVGPRPALAGDSGRSADRGESVAVIDAANRLLGAVVSPGATVSRVALRVGDRLAIVEVSGDGARP